VRLRITITFVALLAVGLLLAGGASLLLVRHAQRNATQRTLLTEGKALVAAVNSPTGKQIATADVLRVITEVSDLNQEGVVTVASDGHVVHTSSPDVPASAINGPALAANHSTSGSYGNIAFAVVPLLSSPAPSGKGHTTVALMFESRESFSDVYYFLFAGGISLLVAAGLATVISGRMSKRVVAAADAADRIAGGDFATRVETRRYDYPEITQLDNAINTMAEDLARGVQAEREFLLSISHDLRTPLTSIRGWAEAIADDAVPDTARAAGVIVAESGRLERLIGDLLVLARLRARQFALDAQPTDAGEAVAAAAEGLRYEFEAVGVSLNVELPVVAITAELDSHRIGQIVANLAENALKFATHSVSVVLAAETNALRISVIDDGPGIAPEDLPHVFERLYTSTRHQARAAGTGIGLSIVSELALAMHGEIEVTSPLNAEGGTRIDLIIPHESEAEPDPSVSL
jgi:two-component system sensor histidine kinase BaeS